MHVFRSSFGKVITVIVTTVILLALVLVAINEGLSPTLQSIPMATFIIYGCILLFWLPRVEVDDGGVRIVNIIRTHYLSWAAIERIDTRYALTLFSGNKKYTAWGATAPGRHAAFFATKDQGTHLPETTYLAGTVRPGDLVTSESGAAASVIRRQWESLQGQNGQASVSTNWHPYRALGLIAIAFAAALSF